MASWEKIRKCFQAVGGDQIKDQASWQLLSASLLRNNHLSVEDSKILDAARPPLPLTWEEFVAFMSGAKMPQVLRDLLYNAGLLNETLLNVQALAETWNPKSLSNDELAQLMTRLAAGETLAEKAWRVLQEANGRVSSYSEEVQRGLYDKLQNISAPVKTAHDFQEEEQVNIERQWFERRVRHVQYRNRAIKVLKELENGVIKQIGFCADKDTPLEVLKVPQTLYDFEFLTALYDTLDALKQLTLSKYYADYLGFDDVGEVGYCLYFFELYRGRSIRKLLIERPKKPGPNLLNFWIREMLNAMADLLHKCTHSLNSPLSLSNVSCRIEA
mmetsp:Transcript_20127/g.37425  ORF Transcript_20127/g.37425 Transcript_20127/m.37425 type:complete len:329 (-) Transcript_20127:1657-2643(-)